jgi:hypothetical protein
MIGTIRRRHLPPIHTTRKCLRTHSGPVEGILLINLYLRIRRFRRDHARSSTQGWPRGQAKCQSINRNADHVSLPLCRAYLPTTSGVWLDAVLSVIITTVPSFTGSEFSLWARCVLCITQAVDATDDISSQPGSGKSSLIKTIFNVDMSVRTRSSLHSFLPTYALATCKRAPTNVSGMTVEFRPRDNRHLIIHECSAFGPGELQATRDFITTRNHKSCQASERLHAIW